MNAVLGSQVEAKYPQYLHNPDLLEEGRGELIAISHLPRAWWWLIQGFWILGFRF
jgi:hypothetical protein